MRDMLQLQSKWKMMLTGGTLQGGTEPLWASKIGRVTEVARCHLASICLKQGAEVLWSDLPRTEDARDMHQMYMRLKEMAAAHETEGSALYRNEALGQAVLQGLEWVYKHRYNEHTSIYGNWWFWEIGAPLSLLDTLILIHDRLSPERLAAYLRSVDRCTPEPDRYLNSIRDEPVSSTGANRVWKCRVYLLSSLLKRDASGIAAARDALDPVFAYAKEGDGFYEDGSFIQHGRYPYTGGYGKSLLKELADLLAVLNGSLWEVSREHARTMVRWVDEAFEPLMFRGVMADMASGREISRHNLQNHESGHAIIGAVLRLTETVPTDTADRLRRMVKQWMIADTYKSFIEGAELDLAVRGWRLLHDASVKPRDERQVCHVFAHMDRAILQRPGFAFGISMFSTRILPYESINGENLHGWYTAHGMTYLYNADLAQYCDGFWPTVNPYRMPGTTVNTVPRNDGDGAGRLNASPYAGGAVWNGQYGAVGMELQETGTAAYRARKSWFLFNDAIVALGSGIRGADQAGRMETIIDNRMLNQEAGNTITVESGSGSCTLSSGSTDSYEVLDTRWVHLEGSVEGADIGYVFPHRLPVHLMRETRSGRWKDINAVEPDTELTRHYMTLWFDHGVQPEDAEYAYVLLPGRKSDEVAAYADQPHVEIVECSTEAHAVKETKLKLFAAHFWEDRVKSVGPVTCDRRASILLKEDADTIEAAAADPTQENEGTVTIRLAMSACEVLEQDERVTVYSLQPNIVLTVDTDGAKGGTCRVVFRKASESEWLFE